jgi:hypothetical protein
MERFDLKGERGTVNERGVVRASMLVNRSIQKKYGEGFWDLSGS